MENNQPAKTQNTSESVIIEERISKDNGEFTIKKYSKGKFLGKGGFAKCFEFFSLDTKKVLAAKIIAKNSLTRSRAREKLISEIKIHKSLHHVNVVAFEHVFEDQENVYILLELCTNNTLNDILKRRKRLTELEVQCYTVQIVNGLKYLHSHQVIHRDLKLGNLFLNDKMELKLGDFGLAIKFGFNEEKKPTICGMPNYIAPEMLEGKARQSYEVDIWSLGVIIYTLLVGTPPFATPDVKQTYSRIRNCDYHFPKNVSVSKSAKNLITKILSLDPSKRPTLEEILQHPFINNGGIIPLTMPGSTFTLPPTATYMKQYLPPLGSHTKLEIQPLLSVIKDDRKYKLTQDIKDGSKGEIVVKKWVGYSSKYELGDLLSTGVAAVIFNDSTRIILDLKGENFEYRERRVSDKQDIVTTHSLNNYPKELQKKVTLLLHFKNYLEGEAGTEIAEEDKNPENQQTVYVKKWMKTKHAIIFRLSNKIVQVSFTDKTEIILSSENKTVIYVNKKGEKSYHVLATAPESSNSEIAKRLKYTKDILTHTVNNNRQVQYTERGDAEQDIESLVSCW